MKVLVVGGVAAGTKVAAKLKRENRNAEVIIYTKSTDISYAGCGLPYYVGGVIESRDELIVNTNLTEKHHLHSPHGKRNIQIQALKFHTKYRKNRHNRKKPQNNLVKPIFYRNFAV